MQALQGEMTVLRLQELQIHWEDRWCELCGKISHLDKRIEMIMGVKVVEDAIQAYQETQRPYAETLFAIRMGILTLELQVGPVEVQRLLESMPLAFLPAVTSTYLMKDDWIEGDQVDETEYLAGFLSQLSTCQQTIYTRDPEGLPAFDFHKCLEDVAVYARDMDIPAVAIEEIVKRVDAFFEVVVGDMLESGEFHLAEGELHVRPDEEPETAN